MTNVSVAARELVVPRSSSFLMLHQFLHRLQNSGESRGTTAERFFPVPKSLFSRSNSPMRRRRVPSFISRMQALYLQLTSVEHLQSRWIQLSHPLHSVVVVVVLSHWRIFPRSTSTSVCWRPCTAIAPPWRPSSGSSTPITQVRYAHTHDIIIVVIGVSCDASCVCQRAMR